MWSFWGTLVLNCTACKSNWRRTTALFMNSITFIWQLSYKFITQSSKQGVCGRKARQHCSDPNSTQSWLKDTFSQLTQGQNLATSNYKWHCSRQKPAVKEGLTLVPHTCRCTLDLVCLERPCMRWRRGLSTHILCWSPPTAFGTTWVLCAQTSACKYKTVQSKVTVLCSTSQGWVQVWYFWQGGLSARCDQLADVRILSKLYKSVINL
jgi:hypothetical protein